MLSWLDGRHPDPLQKFYEQKFGFEVHLLIAHYLLHKISVFIDLQHESSDLLVGIPLVWVVPAAEQLPSGGEVSLLLDVLVYDCGLHGLVFL